VSEAGRSAGAATGAAATLAGALRAAAAQLDRAGVDSPALTARVLMARAVGQPREWLTAHGDQPLDAAAAQAFARLLERVAAREPLAYVLGRREFFGLELAVDRRVLVPRPETELLVELALEHLRGRPPADGLGEVDLIDVGTGSGAVAIAVAAHAPGARVLATDVSADALEVARDNTARHGLAGRLEFARRDLLEGVDQRAWVVTANLPYVTRAEIDGLPPEIQEHEPRVALDGGDDGLDLVRRLLRQLPDRLRPGGAAFLEIGASQGAGALSAARQALPGWRLEIRPDLARRDRALCVWHVPTNPQSPIPNR
jgi:release factor glutamine methyltransferase